MFYFGLHFWTAGTSIIYMLLYYKYTRQTVIHLVIAAEVISHSATLPSSESQKEPQLQI